MNDPRIEVQIVRYTEDYPPGLVECSIIDADGRETLFEIKQVYVTEEELSFESTFPRPGQLDCDVVEHVGDRVRIIAEGREFTVLENQITWPTHRA